MTIKPLFPLDRLRAAGLLPCLDVGSLVGSRRWPYVGGHPGNWAEPHKGIILSQEDIRAWTGTLAFSGIPSQEAVNGHVSRLHRENLLLDCVPVLWTFWAEDRVYWGNVRSLVPADEDRRNWLRERSIEFDRHAASYLAAA